MLWGTRWNPDDTLEFFPYVSLRFGFAAIIKGPFSYSKEAGNEEEQGGDPRAL